MQVRPYHPTPPRTPRASARGEGQAAGRKGVSFLRSQKGTVKRGPLSTLPGACPGNQFSSTEALRLRPRQVPLPRRTTLSAGCVFASNCEGGQVAGCTHARTLPIGVTVVFTLSLRESREGSIMIRSIYYALRYGSKHIF